jgi:hypothetical protein
MFHVAGPQFAMPALLYRNIATTDLYNADWRIVGASITFKALTGVGFMAGVENPQNSPPTARYGVTWHVAVGRPPMMTWHVRR